jgi:transposase
VTCINTRDHAPNHTLAAEPRYLHRRGIKVRIARRRVEDKSKLGRVRWVIERTISWLLRFKRLGLRYDRTERTTLPLLTLACAIINIRRLIKTES